MSKIDNAVNWAVSIANDDSHGYDQANRWGPDYDCSSLVISAWQQAGVPVKDKGATYTGNMKKAFLACGFVEVPLADRKRGDVLLNEKHHTAMMIDSKNLVQASINEQGKITGGKKGDQTGREIRTQAYYRYSSGWNCVLRYMGDQEPSKTEPAKNPPAKSVDEIAREVIAGSWGNGAQRKKKLEAAGYNYAEVQAAVNKALKTAPETYIVNTQLDALNIRRTPGGQIIGTLPKGSRIQVAEIVNKWAKLAGRDGYVSVDYLKKA